jgi:hypothetical protein
MSIQVGGFAYGATRPPFAGNRLKIREMTLLLGPLGRMHGTRLVDAMIALFSASLAYFVARITASRTNWES